MILYFSGTGNSRYVAQGLANLTGDTCHSLTPYLQKKENLVLESDNAFAIVCPVYAWRIPKVIEKLLLNASLSCKTGKAKVYFVVTCGAEPGCTNKYVKALCLRKGWEYMGTCGIVMPDNYVVLYPVNELADCMRRISRAAAVLPAVADMIKASQPFRESKDSLLDKIKSNIVNPVFYTFLVKSSGFYTQPSCNSCGKCVKICPLGNITLHEKSKTPRWGRNCTHCMACINLCPNRAIEYKMVTRDRKRYCNDLPAPTGEESKE